MKPVRTKQDFVRRFQSGEFGNRMPTWDTYDDWFCQERETDPQLYHLRNRVKGGKTFYNVPGYTLYIWNQAAWVHQPNWYVSQMAPTELTLFQGEVTRGVDGLLLTWTSVRLPMRDALKALTITDKGLRAKYLLEHYLDYQSYEWLNHLLDTYEDHIIEFSTYEKKVGLCNTNTLIWEVRMY